MRSKKRTAAAGVSCHYTHNLPHQPQLCFEGENLTGFLKSIQREIESAKSLDANLPLKFWIKQQFAVGVNEVTRTLERMPSSDGTKISSEKHLQKNGDYTEAPCLSLQAILLASDCNPRSLTKHIPALAASRNVPLISVKDRKEASLRLGELLKLNTAIAIGIKAKGNAINQLMNEVLTHGKIDSIEA